MVSFRQKITMPVLSPPSVYIFSRPYLSARTPGMIRPKVEAALVIASKYEANAGSMPLVTAYVGMKNKGVNMPRNMKNSELIRRRYLVFLNASAMKKDVVLGGRRGLTVKHENPISGIMTNPMIRTDQPNPIEESFNILDKAIGNTTPPIEEPETTTPNAAARFLSKYCETAANAGSCINAIATPMSTPCASMNCQYLVQRLVIMVANI